MLLLLLPLLLLSLNLSVYLLGQFLTSFVFKAQDLRCKYKAQWALVTGASSGIGKALAWKCAEQNLNIVLVSMPDPILDETATLFSSKFPSLEIRKLGIDLSNPDALQLIQKATDDIEIQIIFCNAGYMVTGFFHDTPLQRQLDNIQVNATSAIAISHHFIAKLVILFLKIYPVVVEPCMDQVAKKRSGCVVFTSSPAGCMPGPFAALYNATKSFLSMFGASIAPEVKSHGIDILVFHPSPVASRFYINQKKMDILEFFKSFAAKPEAVPDQVFACIGRCIWADLGTTSTIFRTLTKLIDFNFLCIFLSRIAHLLPDYKRHNKP